MTTPDPTLTPAQMLELLARYVDVQQRLERAGRTQEVYTLENSPQLLQMRINALNPATLRAQAAALAEREAEVERLRVAAREMLALQDGPQDAAYRELLPIVLRRLRAALTPTQEAR